MNNKIFARIVIIFSFLTFISMQSCYLFCLFKPDNRIEELVEQFVEEEMGIQPEETPVKTEAPSPEGKAL